MFTEMLVKELKKKDPKKYVKKVEQSPAAYIYNNYFDPKVNEFYKSEEFLHFTENQYEEFDNEYNTMNIHIQNKYERLKPLVNRFHTELMMPRFS